MIHVRGEAEGSWPYLTLRQARCGHYKPTFESGHKVMAWKFLKVLTEA